MKVKFCLLVFLMSFNMCWFLRVNVGSLWFYLRRVLPPLPFLLSWSPFTHFFVFLYRYYLHHYYSLHYAVRRQILLVTLSPCRFRELTIRTHCLSHCENSFFLSINLQSS